jgi:hypothetical protein
LASSCVPPNAYRLPIIEAGESHPAQTAGPLLAVAPSLAIRPAPGRASCPTLWASAWARSGSRPARSTGHAGSGVAPFGLGIVPGLVGPSWSAPTRLRPQCSLGGLDESPGKTGGGSLRSRHVCSPPPSPRWGAFPPSVPQGGNGGWARCRGRHRPTRALPGSRARACQPSGGGLGEGRAPGAVRPEGLGWLPRRKTPRSAKRVVSSRRPRKAMGE